MTRTYMYILANKCWITCKFIGHYPAFYHNPAKSIFIGQYPAKSTFVGYYPALNFLSYIR